MYNFTHHNHFWKSSAKKPEFLRNWLVGSPGRFGWTTTVTASLPLSVAVGGRALLEPIDYTGRADVPADEAFVCYPGTDGEGSFESGGKF